MYYTLLPQRGLIRFSGEDSKVFLQGLISNDVFRLEREPSLYAAMLTPQGKFQDDFILAKWQGAIIIDIDQSRLPGFLNRLKIYRLRSRVTMDAVPELSVAALWGAGDAPPAASKDITLFPDPRVAELGWRMIGSKAAIEAATQNMNPARPEDYDRMRLELGVPDGARDMVEGKSLLLHFGFEDLHGVDFNKGCYVGQEVTARSKHLGQAKKFLYKVKSSAATLLPPGTPIHLGDTLSGEMRTSAGDTGIAILKVEDVTKSQAGGSNLRCGDVTLSASLPAWVKNTP